AGADGGGGPGDADLQRRQRDDAVRGTVDFPGRTEHGARDRPYLRRVARRPAVSDDEGWRGRDADRAAKPRRRAELDRRTEAPRAGEVATSNTIDVRRASGDERELDLAG